MLFRKWILCLRLETFFNDFYLRNYFLQNYLSLIYLYHRINNIWNIKKKKKSRNFSNSSWGLLTFLSWMFRVFFLRINFYICLAFIIIDVKKFMSFFFWYKIKLLKSKQMIKLFGFLRNIFNLNSNHKCLYNYKNTFGFIFVNQSFYCVDKH